MDNSMNLNDKHTQRIIEYLKQIGWNGSQIVEFIAYITKQ